MTTPILAGIIAALLIVLLYAIRKGRRIVAQWGSIHFELTENGKSSSIKNKIHEMHAMQLNMLQVQISLVRRVAALEEELQRPPAA